MHCPKFIWHSIIFLMVPKNWLIWVPCVSDPLPSYKKGVGPKVLLFAFLYVGCLCIVPRIIHTAFQFLFTLVMGTSNLCLSVQFFEKQERKSYQTVYNNRLLDIMSWGHQRGYFTPLRTIDINLYSDRLREMYLWWFHTNEVKLHHSTLSIPILNRPGKLWWINK